MSELSNQDQMEQALRDDSPEVGAVLDELEGDKQNEGEDITNDSQERQASGTAGRDRKSTTDFIEKPGGIIAPREHDHSGRQGADRVANKRHQVAVYNAGVERGDASTFGGSMQEVHLNSAIGKLIREIKPAKTPDLHSSSAVAPKKEPSETKRQLVAEYYPDRNYAVLTPAGAARLLKGHIQEVRRNYQTASGGSIKEVLFDQDNNLKYYRRVNDGLYEVRDCGPGAENLKRILKDIGFDFPEDQSAA